jgi:UDP-N-acetylglucosamine/UDP-N-acetyl-alpha-D-glucosaminouronate 4-epimerase
MGRTVLVTGGAGFIGSHLARALLARGDSVRVLDDFSSGKRANLSGLDESRLRILDGSILDEATLDRALSGVELVFHEAAIPSVPRSLAAPVASHQANATGTLLVLEAARRHSVRRVVYAGSSSAYGETPTLPKVETMPALPLSPYAVSKLAGEHYCQVYARAFGVETVVLRYFNVFGPRQDPQSQYAAVIPRFVTAALAGQRPTIFGDGTQSRDFCYIDNVLEANLLAGDAREASGRVFNVACGAATSLNEVVRLIGDALGVSVEPQYETARVGDIKHSLADIGQARAILGYTASIPFAEGLLRTIEWYKRQA